MQNTARNQKTMFNKLSHEERFELITLAQNGDLKARNKLIEANIGLIVNIAGSSTYKNCKLDFEERKSEGMFGLIKAIEGFNPKLGFQFSTYAGTCIRRAISEAISQNTRDFTVSKDFVSKAHQAKEVFNSLDDSFSENEKIDEVARLTGVSRTKAREYIFSNPYAKHYDNTFGNSDDDSRYNDVKDEISLTPEEEFDRNTYIKAVQKALAKLKNEDERMFYVVTEHNGFFSEDGSGSSFSEIGRNIGVTKQQACNIEKKALNYINRIVESELAA